jgi:hypothetical protein
MLAGDPGVVAIRVPSSFRDDRRRQYTRVLSGIGWPPGPICKVRVPETRRIHNSLAERFSNAIFRSVLITPMAKHFDANQRHSGCILTAPGMSQIPFGVADLGPLGACYERTGLGHNAMRECPARIEQSTRDRLNGGLRDPMSCPKTDCFLRGHQWSPLTVPRKATNCRNPGGCKEAISRGRIDHRSPR